MTQTQVALKRAYFDSSLANLEALDESHVLGELARVSTSMRWSPNRKMPGSSRFGI